MKKLLSIPFCDSLIFIRKRKLILMSASITDNPIKQINNNFLTNIFLLKN